MSKSWWQSKSVWLGVLMVLAAVIEYLAGLPAGTSAIQAVSGALTIAVRLITNSGISNHPDS